MTASFVIELLVAALVVIGAFFTLSGSIGLVRFPDFFLRLHGPTKATTLGVGSLLLASAAHFSFESGQVRFEEVLIMLFLFMTAPVSAHLLAKAALHLGVPSKSRLPRKNDGAAGWAGAEQASEGTAAAADPAGARATRHSGS